MSKKYRNNRGGNRGGGNSAAKSKHTLIKVIAVGLFLLGVAYVITSLALGMQWNPLKWVKTSNKENSKSVTSVIGSEDKLSVIDDNIYDKNYKLQDKTVYAMPRSIAFTTRETTPITTASSLWVSVTVLPANADDKRLTWSSSDPQAVSVTPDSANCSVAEIKYLSRFSSVVEITCTSVDNPKVSSKCNINCLFIPSSSTTVDFDIHTNGSMTNLLKFGSGIDYEAVTYMDMLTCTIFPEMCDINIYVDLAPAVHSKICELYPEYSSADLNNYIFNSSTFSLGNSPFQLFGDLSYDEEKYNTAFKQAVKSFNGQNIFEVYVSGHFKYGTVDLGRFSTDSEIFNCDISAIWVNVEGLEPDTGDIIFGQQ